MTWELKVDEGGAPVLQDGKPVYVDPDGKEFVADVPVMHGKILDLGKESKRHREAAEAAEARFKIFKDIEDLDEWKKSADEALEHVANFKEQDWLKADKVAKLKKEMTDAFDEKHETQKRSYEAQLADKDETIKKKDVQIRTLLISNKFATSPLFSGDDPKTTLPPEMAEAYFGKFFKIEEKTDGELHIVAYDKNGDQIISRRNVGEPAEFDEAIESIFDSFPGKDRLLKAKGSGSGGAGGGGGGEKGVPADIKKLEEDYQKAVEAKDARKMTAIKNQIWALKQKVKTAA